MPAYMLPVSQTFSVTLAACFSFNIMLDPNAEPANGSEPTADTVIEPVQTAAEPEAGDDVLNAPVIGDGESRVEPKAEDDSEPKADEEEAKDLVEDVDVTTAEEENPVTFDIDAEVPVLVDQVNGVLDKYDLDSLPPDLRGAVEALIAKVQVVPEAAPNPIAAFTDFGDEAQVTTLLERQSYLDTSREVEPGKFRPNTDKFVESLAKNPIRAAWTYHDLGELPSTKYVGRTQAQEKLIDSIAIEGDTISSVLERWEKTVEAFKADALPDSTLPAFVPKHVREAFYRQIRATRDFIEGLDPAENSDMVAEEVARLEREQKGIDGERREEQRQIAAREQDAREFTSEVETTTIQFFDTFRDAFAADLVKDVTFSTDPKMQTLLAHQHVTLLTQAFDDTKTGEFARKTLTDAGIQFDFARAQSLVNDIQAAALGVTTHKRAVDPATKKVIDPVALNRATKQFGDAGLKWQEFAKEILDQVSTLTSTKKEEEIKEAVAKQKVAIKARPGTRGSPTVAKKQEGPPSNIAYGSPEWDQWHARQTLLEREQAKARQYA